jgi:hypothetical protein
MPDSPSAIVVSGVGRDPIAVDHHSGVRHLDDRAREAAVSDHQVGTATDHQQWLLPFAGLAQQFDGFRRGRRGVKLADGTADPQRGQVREGDIHVSPC